MKRTEAQELLAVHLRELQMIGNELLFEHRFCEGRRWRFDVALPDKKIAFECDGHSPTGSHTRVWENDAEKEKMNTAQALGWRVFRFSNRQVLTGKAKAWLKEWL